MLGVIFTNLIEMMEQEVGLELTGRVLDEADLASNGSYTSVGFYPPEEILSIVATLSKHTGIPEPELVESFGYFLFQRLAEYHPPAIQNKTSIIEVLSILDSNVHVEVQKLYPDAQLPTFETIEESERRIKLLYTSPNNMEALAKGLILGGANYFNENVDVIITPKSATSSYIEVESFSQD